MKLYILISVLIVLFAGVGFGIWWKTTTNQRAVEKLRIYPPDGQLRDFKGGEQGNLKLDHFGSVFKLVYTLKYDPARPDGEYYGWLYDPEQKEYRYAGYFDKLQGGDYSLVFTTEEDMSRFKQILVSKEGSTPPKNPSDIIFGGAVALTSPSASPSSTEELNVTPEVSSSETPIL